MTRAPANLMAVRSLLIANLDIHENSSAYRTDLDPAEVGIVGDTAHIKQGDSYHLGTPEQRSSGYSVDESPRDKAGLSDLACALDVGWFEWRDALGRVHSLATFSAWLVSQCAAGATDTRDIREVIYSPDGKVVRRWDRLGRRSAGDDSHLYHTHISYFRDAIKAGRDQTPLFRRYLTTIGRIKGDDMSAAAETQIAELHAALLDKRQGGYGVTTVQMLRDASYSVVKGNTTTTWLGQVLVAIAQSAGLDAAELDAVRAAAREGAVSASEQLATQVLAGLTPDKIAAAIPAELARQVADELGRRLTAQ